MEIQKPETAVTNHLELGPKKANAMSSTQGQLRRN
jgi:hypothetical protein